MSYKKDKEWLYRSKKSKRKSRKIRSNISETTSEKWKHKLDDQKKYNE